MARGEAGQGSVSCLFLSLRSLPTASSTRHLLILFSRSLLSQSRSSSSSPCSRHLSGQLLYHLFTINTRHVTGPFQPISSVYLDPPSVPPFVSYREWWSRGRAPHVIRGDGGSIPPTAVSKLRQFRSPHICLCLSEETLKAGGPIWFICQGK